MTEEKRKDMALLRYGIIAPAVCNILPPGETLESFFTDAAKKVYTDTEGVQHRYSKKTLERWYYFYLNHGFEALVTQPRSDYGKSRKIDTDILEQIRYLKEQEPRITATDILEKLEKSGTVLKGTLSLSTVTRCVSRIAYEMDLPGTQDMHRYERPHINEVWCGDSCVGPKITIDGNKHRIYIVALIDDASRYVVGAMAFIQDNFVSLLKVMKSAVSKFGVPRMWNFDNGGTYKNKQMELLAARIGSSIHYCHPYTPTQKAKIERWFRTLRDKWMATTNMSEFSSLAGIQESLDGFVDRYNHTVHSSLNGKTPDERFFSEPEYIRRLAQEDIDRNFLLELDRKVSADSVVSIDNVEYEVDSRYAKKRVKLRYSADMQEIYLVEPNDVLTPIRLLNKVENAKRKREKIYLSGGDR